MKRAGLVARRQPADTMPRAGFAPRPVTYVLGRGSRMEVFLYRDEKALAPDVAKLDTLLGAPVGTPRTPTPPPVWIRSANLLALLFTLDAREADRVSLAITAGPPQPWK